MAKVKTKPESKTKDIAYGDDKEVFTNSGVVGEEDRQKGELPDESDDGADNPNDQQNSDLLDAAQDEQNIDQSVPKMRILRQAKDNIPIIYQGRKLKREMNSFFQTGPISLRVSLMLLSFSCKLSTLVATHSLLVQLPT